MPYVLTVTFKEGKGLFDRVSALRDFLKTSDIIESIRLDEAYSYPIGFNVSHINIEKVCESMMIDKDESKRFFIFHGQNLINDAKKAILENTRPNFIIPFIKLIREHSSTFITLKVAKEYVEKLVYEGKPY